MPFAETVVLEKTVESHLDSKEIKPVNPKGNQSWMNIHWKDWCWSGSSNTLAIWWEEMTHCKRPWFWERLKAGGEREDRGNDWMATLTQGTWVSASSGRWWRTEKPGMLQSIGSQRVRHDWLTEQQQRDNHTKGSKWERQISYGITYTWNLKCDTNELIYETEIDSEHRKQICGCQEGR